MTKWEYYHGHDLTIEDLDEYGAEGWELVTVLLQDGEERYLFKRQVPDTTVVADDGRSMNYPSQYG